MPFDIPESLADDRYRLTRLLGRGGMGRVWAARDRLLQRDVAIKELISRAGLPEPELRALRERVIREARAIAALDHRTVVRVFDVLFERGEPWIVMELVPSRSLYAAVSEDGPLPPERVARIGLDVLGALRVAHRAGVLHRDVKPANVLLAHDDGRAVLTDFGLAAVAGDSGLTHTGIVVGSPSYLAPERALDQETGPAADLWSLGATLYTAVEGRPPYGGSSPVATLAALATAPPPEPRRAGPLLAALEALLQRDPSKRADADTAERLLREALTTPPTILSPGDSGELPKLGLAGSGAQPESGEPSQTSPSSQAGTTAADPAPADTSVRLATTLVAAREEASPGTKRGGGRMIWWAAAIGVVTLAVTAGFTLPRLLASAPVDVQAGGAVPSSAVAVPAGLPQSSPGASRAASNPPANRPSAGVSPVAPGKTAASPGNTTKSAAASATTTAAATAAPGKQMQNMQTGTCLYAPGSTGEIVLWACTGADPERFDLPGDGTLRVRGNCVQIPSTDDGVTLQLARCSGAAAQQFTLNASYDLVSGWADRCVEVPGSDSANGVPAKLATCSGPGNQKWRY